VAAVAQEIAIDPVDQLLPFGLAYFLYLGSPASKENDDRLEAKIDEILRLNAGKAEGQELIDRIDRDFLRHGGHARPVGKAG
jgi:hypothetical protein